jgi:hypothetical protein
MSAALLGAWAILAPLSAGAGEISGWLIYAPGAAAIVLGGLAMPAIRNRAGALVALAGATWLVCAPATFMVAGGSGLPKDDPLQALIWLIFFAGIGALVALLAVYVLGILAPWLAAGAARRRRLLEPAPCDARRRRSNRPHPGGRQDRRLHARS